MIGYDWQHEGWIDDNDDNFFVDMTPEGGKEELDQTFNTREDFFTWYFGGFESEEEIKKWKSRNCYIRK